MEPFLPYYDLYILQDLYTKKMRARRRSSHQRCSLRNGVLRNFTTFTEKHLRQSLFFNKVAGLSSPTLCRTIDTLVKTSLSLVLLFVGLLKVLSKRWNRSYDYSSWLFQLLLCDNQLSGISEHYLYLTWHDWHNVYLFMRVWDLVNWPGLLRIKYV